MSTTDRDNLLVIVYGRGAQDTAQTIARVHAEKGGEHTRIVASPFLSVHVPDGTLAVAADDLSALVVDDSAPSGVLDVDAQTRLFADAKSLGASHVAYYGDEGHRAWLHDYLGGY